MIIEEIVLIIKVRIIVIKIYFIMIGKYIKCLIIMFDYNVKILLVIIVILIDVIRNFEIIRFSIKEIMFLDLLIVLFNLKNMFFMVIFVVGLIFVIFVIVYLFRMICKCCFVKWDVKCYNKGECLVNNLLELIYYEEIFNVLSLSVDNRYVFL